ncbi:hypothetical protein BSKO_01742 [Bryopsis sp. KO-2023]|nr:hypothetical protein BSKO_01742 [Bryopsis sp. KO-2023]
MAEGGGANWDFALERLFLQRIISGYALLTVSGRCEKVVGVLSKEFESQGPLPASAKQVFDPFVEASGHPTSFLLCGHKVVVFLQSSRSYYGVSHRRRLGIGICRVPFGVIVVSFGRQPLPQIIVSEVETICNMMWS